MFDSQLVIAVEPKTNEWFSSHNEVIRSEYEVNRYVLYQKLPNSIGKVVHKYHSFIATYGVEPVKLIMGVDYYQSLICSVYESRGQVNFDTFMGKDIVLIPDYDGFYWSGDNKFTLINVLRGEN